MANNYSQFSEIIAELNLEEQAWAREELQELDEREDRPKDEEGQAEYDKKFAEDRGLELDDNLDRWPDFMWKVDSARPRRTGEQPGDEIRDLWLYAEIHFNSDDVVTFVQRFLQRFRPDAIFKMTWADTCSTPRIGEFGGGWIVVSANDTENGNARRSADEAANEMGEKPCQKKKPSSSA